MIASLVAALTLLFPNGQPAPTWQQIADRSQVPLPSGTVVLNPNSCPVGGHPGCLLDGVVYVDRSRRPQRSWVLLHELGHVYDRQTLTDTERAVYQAASGDTSAWFAPGGSQERFADDYTACAKGYPVKYRLLDVCAWLSRR